MRAISVFGPYDVRIIDEPIPKISRNQILVRTQVSGISAGTEISIYRGTHPDLRLKKWGYRDSYPTHPGYENVGEIVEVGSDARYEEKFSVGDRVVCSGFHAEYVAIPAQWMRHRYDLVARLPDNVTNEEGALAILASGTMSAIRRAKIEYGDTVAILGQGAAGVLIMQHAKNVGAGQVIVTDVQERNLEISKQLGADQIIRADRENVPERVRELTDGLGADVVIEAAGVAETVLQAFETVRDHGRIVVYGFGFSRPIPLDLAAEFHHKNLQVYAAAGHPPPGLPLSMIRWTTDRALKFAIQLIAQGRLRVKPMITHRFSPEEIGNVYKMIDKRMEPYMQIILDWRR